MLAAQFPPPIHQISGMDAGGSYPVSLTISMPSWGDPAAEDALIAGIVNLVAAVPGLGLTQVTRQSSSEVTTNPVQQQIT